MSAYYYLAASLPMLTDSEQNPPMASEQMLDFCRRLMTDDDYNEIARSSLDPAGGVSSRIAAPYRAWERSLRNDLARLRATEWSWDAEAYVRESDTVFGTVAVAEEAMRQSTPLAAETFLNKCRWMKIDELTAGHFFDMEFLSAYRLKLLIQERQAMFDEERGFSAYRAVYSLVLAASLEGE